MFLRYQLRDLSLRKVVFWRFFFSEKKKSFLLTYSKIPFLAHRSMNQSICLDSCHHHHHQNSKLFHHPPNLPLAVLSQSYLLAPLTHFNIWSFCHPGSFVSLRMPRERDDTVRSLLRLSSFTQHDVCKSHPRCCGYQ